MPGTAAWRPRERSTLHCPYSCRRTKRSWWTGRFRRGEDEAEVEPRFNPIEYLEQQDIVARRRRIHVSPHEAGDTLLHEAERMGSDLLVMGAYGRSRLRERVLGGATRRILQQATLPVLMQH